MSLNNASSHFQTREGGLQESSAIDERGDGIPPLGEAMIADARKATNQAVILSKSHPMSAVVSES